MEFQVRALDGGEEKSMAQVEQELLDKHAQEQEAAAQAAAEAKAAADAEAQAAASQSSEESDDLSEEKVLSYLGKRYNKQLNSFDDLMAERSQAEELPEDVSAYLKFKKETGRGVEDFVKLQRDFNAMNPDDMLREYFLATQEGVDEDDVEIMLSDYSYDEDLDDETDIKKIKLAKKKIVSEAKKFFEQQKEMYKLPLESKGNGMSDVEREELEAYKQYINSAKTISEENKRKSEWFTKKTDEVFDNGFKGFEFKVGEQSITFNPGEAAEIKKLQSDPTNFISKFMDENGLINDAVGYHKSLAIAMNPDKFAKFFFEQGQAAATDNVARRIKNIDMSATPATALTSSGATQVKSLSNDSGKGLKIRSFNK